MALTAWYRLNNLNDSGPNKLTLSSQGTLQLTNDHLNQPNGAYVFTGTAQSLYRYSATVLDVSNDFSFCVWVKPTAYAASTYFGLQNVVFMKGPATTVNFAVQITSDTSIAFIKRTGSETLVFKTFTGVPSLLNNWTHLAFIVTNGFLNLYINGTYFSQQSVTNIGPGTNDMIFIGNGSQSGGAGDMAFTGHIDDIRLYNHPLAITEITAIYQQGESGTTNFFAG